ncbi:hypothetical protein GQ55_9G137500 [Panicum hallii var. hallii]|uniref:F-box domain-containing protein n=1 Tax=Panicum hallii var. hallii TaxID=1504633 RepID=A0A2T7C2W8_9POAL|nr:hypothetical protein GQ55_9G137500 [Panicum hallii var. hallii]
MPDGVLADVLGRLAQRDLAVSRSVCKAWRAVVDDHGMLRTELLPLSLVGLLIKYNCWRSYAITEFFARPSRKTKKKGPRLFSRPSSSPVSGMRHYLPEAGGRSWGYVRDHCHGLLLVDGAGRDDYHRPLQYVLNPATRRVNSCEDRYLAYDPADSPHYQVVSVTRFLCKRKPSDIFYDRPNYQLDPVVERSEWPPSLYTLHVLSSRTGRWEERSFARQGGAAGTVADMRHSPHEKWNAVYWRGALYVHCQTDFVMRIRVWKLEESGCEIRWVLRHDNNLFELLKRRINGGVEGRPWILQDINCNHHKYKQDDDSKPLVEERSEWSSEASMDDRFAWSSDNEDEIVSERKFFIFLSESITTGMAYHLNSSKIEALRNLYPGRYDEELPNERFITSAFPYTPCWIKHIGDSKDSIERHLQV